MIKKLLPILIVLLILIPSMSVSANISPCADIIDTKQNMVLKSVQMNSEIYNTVTKWVNSIDNFYGKLSPMPIEGYKVRIPLDPPVDIQKKSLTSVVKEVYIVVPQDKPPFLIIYETRNKPSYFKFHGDINSLSKALDFKLKN